MHESSVLESADTADTAAPTKHHVRRIIVSVVALVLLLMVGTGAAYLGFINHIVKTEVTHAALMPSPVAGEPVPTRDPVAGKALNILLVGSDSRTTVANGRSDVIVLVHVTSDRKHAYLVHFPRDLYVDVPGHGKDKINAVLSPYDGISMGILSSLKAVGYGTKDQPLPFVSGQDCEIPSVKSILKGEQYSTIFKDTRELAKVTANMIDALLAGKSPEVNDTKTYNNGVKIVPSYLLKPVSVDVSNWKPILIDSGYYKESQIK